VPMGSRHRERDERITTGLTSRAAPAQDGGFRHRAYQGSATREADPWTERQWTTCGGNGIMTKRLMVPRRNREPPVGTHTWLSCSARAGITVNSRDPLRDYTDVPSVVDTLSE
jgi:hypothetical protein